MSQFSFQGPPRILAEDGCSSRLGALLAGLGARRALVVTDPFLASSGLAEAALASLAAAGIEADVFAEVAADPPEAVVEAAAALARERGVEAVVGFGGGSAMDTAKLAALLAASPQPLAAIYGVDLARGPRLPLVQVPTTAGTGSEATPVAIVTTPDGEKKGVVSPLLHADLALLDAPLTVGLPPRATAMTGIDAIVHAVEAYTSRLKKNPLSDALALRALALLSGNLRRAVADGTDLEARRAMLQGALLAGLAFANAPVAAVHALAYPLGGRFHAPHGLSNALVFAEVLAFNLPAAASLYGELAGQLPEDLARGRRDGEGFVAAIAELVGSLPFERRLSQIGVAERDLDQLAADALQVQRLLVNNPRQVTLQDARAIYAAVL